MYLIVGTDLSNKSVHICFCIQCASNCNSVCVIHVLLSYFRVNGALR